MTKQLWTVEAVDMLIALGTQHRTSTLQGGYPVAEWEDRGPIHSIDLLGYLELNDGLWFWRAEFVVGNPPTGNRIGWNTHGRPIEHYETRDYADIVPVITGWLNELPDRQAAFIGATEQP